MIREPDLPRRHDAAPEPARARDPDLGDDDRVLADLDVVADLDEVVDLGPLTDDGPAQRRPVDRRVGADLDVVLDDHAADLRDLAVRASVEGIAEAVTADHRAGVHDDATAEMHALAQHDPRVQHAPLPHLDAGADVGERMDPNVRADDGAGADHREGADRRARIDARIARHDRGWIDAGARGRGGMEDGQQGDERLGGSARAQQRAA